MSFEINGKTVFITGANRGIGRALVEGLLQAGAAKVYAAVRNIESAAPLVSQFGAQVEAIAFDLTKADTVEAAASKCGDVSVLINNAGILRTAGPLSPEASHCLHEEFETNVFGLLRVAQAFAPVLKRNGGGAFVQLNSVVSMKCFPDFATYCASKAAAYSLTQALRQSLSEQRTAVFSVHPGPIATDMAHSAGLDEIADSPTTVVDALLQAFSSGDFHVFPDKMAKQIGAAYDSFAKEVILS